MDSVYFPSMSISGYTVDESKQLTNFPEGVDPDTIMLHVNQSAPVILSNGRLEKHVAYKFNVYVGQEVNVEEELKMNSQLRKADIDRLNWLKTRGCRRAYIPSFTENAKKKFSTYRGINDSVYSGIDESDVVCPSLQAAMEYVSHIVQAFEIKVRPIYESSNLDNGYNRTSR